MKDPKLWDDRGEARSRSQLSAGALKTTTLPTDLRCDREMKMERKEKNKHKSQRADNLPALERFSLPRKIHGIEPKQCRA